MKKFISILVLVVFGVNTDTYAVETPVIPTTTTVIKPVIPKPLPITEPVFPEPTIPKTVYRPPPTSFIRNAVEVGSEVTTETVASANRWKWFGPIGVAVGIILDGLFLNPPTLNDPELDRPKRPNYPPIGFAMSTLEAVPKEDIERRWGDWKGQWAPVFNSNPFVVNGTPGAKSSLYPNPYDGLPLKLKEDGIFGRKATGKIPTLTEITERNLKTFDGPVYSRTDNSKLTPVTIAHIDQKGGIAVVRLPDIVGDDRLPFLDMNPTLLIPLNEFKRRHRVGTKLNLDLMVSERFFFTVNAPLTLPPDEEEMTMVESMGFLVESIHSDKDLLIAQGVVDFRRYVSKISVIQNLCAQAIHPGDLLFLNEITDVAFFHIYNPNKPYTYFPIFRPLEYGRPVSEGELIKRSQFLSVQYQSQIVREILTLLEGRINPKSQPLKPSLTDQETFDLLETIEQKASDFLEQMIVEPPFYQFGANIIRDQKEYLLKIIMENANIDPRFAQVFNRMRFPEFRAYFSHMSIQLPEVFTADIEQPSNQETTKKIYKLPPPIQKPPKTPSE